MNEHQERISQIADQRFDLHEQIMESTDSAFIEECWRKIELLDEEWDQLVPRKPLGSVRSCIAQD